MPTVPAIKKITKMCLCLVQQRSVSLGASRTPALPSCLWRGCTWQASAPGSSCLSRCPSTPSNYLTWVCTARISATSSSATSLSNPPWWHWSRQVRACSTPPPRLRLCWLTASTDWKLQLFSLSDKPTLYSEVPLVLCQCPPSTSSKVSLTASITMFTMSLLCGCCLSLLRPREPCVCTWAWTGHTSLIFRHCFGSLAKWS